MSKNCNVDLSAHGLGPTQSQSQRLSSPHGRQRCRFRGLLQYSGGQSLRGFGKGRALIQVFALLRSRLGSEGRNGRAHPLRRREGWSRRLLLALLLSMGAGLSALPAWASDASICGVWATSHGEAYIRIYRFHGLFDGISLPSASASVAMARVRHQPIILSGFAAAPDHPGVYRYGRIFDPRNGQHFQGRLTLESQDRLKVYGYLGFSWLGGSTQWRRVASRSCSLPEEKGSSDRG